ncbi:MAG: Uma2 family endonuclease [Clostridium luticellarii]|jgi:Uma2 family endonuclease|uniref:Uma2 family endonuclease n=1 Tax=Clostridium luticellarii TaxID=1691940 RepID=UPI002356BD30|nr:Uma2 family endonuclease [Clostridium luticellarii]MCI1945599.1 Uma2 family endonuclease [Clostridium luticellarii]MCI2040798.1 Uma2 family endonuclease [Clostridium luticellarii]
MNNTAKNKIYTYTDYMNYPEGSRIELIDGVIYDMSPAPSRIHQELIMSLSATLYNYIKSNNGNCKVYPSPFDVFLTDDENLDNCKNIVQPDISVICDMNKLNDKGCIGAPDLIIEIVSPSNQSNDYVRKLGLYEHFRVREYWIVNPMNKGILVYRLDDTLLYGAPETYSFADKIKVGIYKDLTIDFNTLDVWR